jgi:hypothetical protein
MERLLSGGPGHSRRGSCRSATLPRSPRHGRAGDRECRSRWRAVLRRRTLSPQRRSSCLRNRTRSAVRPSMSASKPLWRSPANRELCFSSGALLSVSPAGESANAGPRMLGKFWLRYTAVLSRASMRPTFAPPALFSKTSMPNSGNEFCHSNVASKISTLRRANFAVTVPSAPSARDRRRVGTTMLLKD